MANAFSKNRIPIRLPDERWVHITEEHSELAGYYYDVLEAIQEPDEIYSGNSEELIATKEIESGKHLIVIYRELDSTDGFVITAFFTRRISRIRERNKLWPL